MSWDQALVLLAIIILAPPFTYAIVKFGAAGYFRAKQRHAEKQKQKH